MLDHAVLGLVVLGLDLAVLGLAVLNLALFSFARLGLLRASRGICLARLPLRSRLRPELAHPALDVALCRVVEAFDAVLCALALELRLEVELVAQILCVVVPMLPLVLGQPRIPGCTLDLPARLPDLP